VSKRCKLRSRNHCGLPQGVYSLSWKNFVPLGEGVPLERGRQIGVPSKKTLFCRYWLLWCDKSTTHQFIYLLTATCNGWHIENSKNHKKVISLTITSSNCQCAFRSFVAKPPPGALPLDPAGGLSFPDPLVRPPMLTENRRPCPLDSRRPAQAGIKEGYLLKKWLFYRH